MTAVSLTPKGLPDCTLDLTGGIYTLTLTGLTGLSETPRALTPEEEQAGVLAVVPPTVQTSDARYLPLLALRAVEIGMDTSLLADNTPVNADVQLKQHWLLAQLTRVVSLAMIALEPPS